MTATLLVFLGGGAGAVVRYLISKTYNSTQLGFPIGTFLSNVISCIILGALMAILMKKGMDQKLQLLFMTGFCGGFSTFSTFSAETFRLIETGQSTTAIIYVVSSICVCTILLFAAYFLFLKN